MSLLKANKWMSSDGIPYNKMIQHVSYSLPGQITVISNPGGSYTATSLYVEITPIRDNSNFLVIADCQGYISAGATNGWNIAIQRATISNSSVTSTQWVAGVDGTGGDSWMGFYHGSGLGTNSWSKCRTTFDSPNRSAGSTVRYTVGVGGWTSTGTIYLGYDGYGDMGNRITVFEMAA